MDRPSLDSGDSGNSRDELSTMVSNLVESGWCVRCTGRLFARCGRGYENTERGETLLEIFGTEEMNFVPEESCNLCRGLFMNHEHFVERITNELDRVEFDNFLIGTVIDYDIDDREKKMALELGLKCGESMKGEMNRLLGKDISIRMQKDVEFGKPDVVALLDSRFGTVTLQISPVIVMFTL